MFTEHLLCVGGKRKLQGYFAEYSPEADEFEREVIPILLHFSPSLLPRGFEPVSISDYLSSTYKNSETEEYRILHRFLNSVQKNKDLRQIEFIAEHWQASPKDVKKAILAIVKANRKRQKAKNTLTS